MPISKGGGGGHLFEDERFFKIIFPIGWALIQMGRLFKGFTVLKYCGRKHYTRWLKTFETLNVVLLYREIHILTSSHFNVKKSMIRGIYIQVFTP